MKHLWCCILALICVVDRAQAAAPMTMPTVGVEGRLEVDLPGSKLEAKPVTDKAAVLLRLASTRPAADNAIRYDLRYMGLVPGAHDLKNYLVRADGSPTDELPSVPVAVLGLLPADHDGKLVRERAARWPWFGGYRIAMILGIAAWLAMLYPLIFAKRPKKRHAAPPPPPRRTFADRLRPLLDAAARGTLSLEDKGKLERMLLWYWQEKLDLTADSPADAIAALRKHPQAGELLRALEQWLHRRPGETASGGIDTARLLEPYRDVPDPHEALDPTAPSPRVPEGAPA